MDLPALCSKLKNRKPLLEEIARRQNKRESLITVLRDVLSGMPGLLKMIDQALERERSPSNEKLRILPEPEGKIPTILGAHFGWPHGYRSVRR
jgi:hypothetical protein